MFKYEFLTLSHCKNQLNCHLKGPYQKYIFINLFLFIIIDIFVFQIQRLLVNMGIIGQLVTHNREVGWRRLPFTREPQVSLAAQFTTGQQLEDVSVSYTEMARITCCSTSQDICSTMAYSISVEIDILVVHQWYPTNYSMVDGTLI